MFETSCLDNRFDRTNLNTGTAISALVWIDDGDFLFFCNRPFGTFINTGTAVDAIIGNFVSHNSLLISGLNNP
jgi:hypothetical protein